MLIFVLNFRSAKWTWVYYYITSMVRMHLFVKNNDAIIEQQYLNQYRAFDYHFTIHLREAWPQDKRYGVRTSREARKDVTTYPRYAGTSLIQLAIYYGTVWLLVCHDGIFRTLVVSFSAWIRWIWRMSTHICVPEFARASNPTRKSS